MRHHFHVMIVIFLAFCFLSNANAQRVNTPDGEAIVKHETFTSNSELYRLAVTQNSIYISKYTAGDWEQNKSLYMIPPSKFILDFCMQQNSSLGKETVIALLNDMSVYSFTLNPASMAFEGGPIIELPGNTQFGGQGQQFKILSSNYYFLQFGMRFYVNKRDGQGWKLDSAGLKKTQISDICFDKQFKVIAATPRGLFILNDAADQWSRITSIDTAASFLSIFTTKDGTIFTCTNDLGIFYSTDNAVSWTNDTSGIGYFRSTMFGEDGQGTIYTGSTQNSTDLYRKLKNAQSWERIDTNLYNMMGTVTSINSIGGVQTLEAATAYGIFTSSDKGTTWRESSKGIMSEQIYGYVVFPDGKQAVSTTLGIFTQVTPQSPWIKTFPDKGFMNNRVLRTDGSGNIYTQKAIVGFVRTKQPDIYKSSDGGNTWILDTMGLSIVPAAGMASPSIFYVDAPGNQHITVNGSGSTPQLFFTKPAGGIWALDTTGTGLQVPPSNVNASFLAVGSNSDTAMYFSTALTSGYGYNQSLVGSSLYSRKMNGTSWELDTAGLQNSAILSFTSDKNKKMYAGSLNSTGLSNIFYRIPGYWMPIKVPPAATTDALYLQCDMSGTLYVTFGSISGGFGFGGVNRGVYLTADNGQTWEYAGMDSVQVRGLTPLENSMYAYTNRGVYLLGRYTLKVPQLVITPNTINFGTVSKDNFRDTTVRFTNNGNDTLRVSNITSSGQTFVPQTKSFTVAPGAYHDVIIRFTPQTLGIVSGIINVISNDYPNTITLRGNGTGFVIPVLNLSTRNINFGEVDLGTHKDTTIQMSNTGNDTLRISMIRSYNASFTVVDTIKTIGPGETRGLTIEYSPAAIYQASGIIRITSNAPNDSILVTGKGKVPNDVSDNFIQSIKFEINPNPVKITTIVRVELPQGCNLSVKIYDLLGIEVAEIANDKFGNGEHVFYLDRNDAKYRNLIDGIYYCKVTANSSSIVKPIIFGK